MLQQSFDAALAGLIDTRFARTELREEVTIGGHRAFRLELVATGEGLEERGTRSYGYLIRRAEGPPVYIRTTAAPGEEFVHRAVVDHAATTLRTFRPAILGGEAPDDGADELLPAAVAEKRDAILAALGDGDVDAVAELADAEEFRYTFGVEPEGGPAAYWRENPEALDALEQILDMPYTLATGNYVWPFAYDKPANTLTDYERELLEPLGTTYAGESYLGWRAGFRPDGRWVFFVAGD